MENLQNATILEKDYWIGAERIKTVRKTEKKDTRENIVALIVDAMNKRFPEMLKVSDMKFMCFQEDLMQIISRVC